MTRRSLPAFSVPCQFPERSCARALVPNIVASATMHNITFFIEHPQTTKLQHQLRVPAILLRAPPLRAIVWPLAAPERLGLPIFHPPVRHSTNGLSECRSFAPTGPNVWWSQPVGATPSDMNSLEIIPLTQGNKAGIM